MWDKVAPFYRGGGCPVLAAARYMDASLTESNRREWHLRSGNVALVKVCAAPHHTTPPHPTL